MKSGLRLLLSLLVSPSVTLLVSIAVYALIWGWDRGRSLLGRPVGALEGLQASVFYGAVTMVVAYPVLLALLILATLMIRRLGLFRPGVMTSAGGLIGAVPFLPMSRLVPDAPVFLMAGVPSGAAMGWLAWRLYSGKSVRGLP